MWCDIGVNLNSSQFKHDIVDVVARARKAGVTQQIIISSDLDESQEVIALAERFNLWATAGVHPHHASTWDQYSGESLRAQLAHPSVVAVGECGLDFNRNFSPPDAQRIAFTEQLEIAARCHKPVYMHCRDAHDEFLTILDRYRAQLPNAVLHCFTGNRQQLRDCLHRDLFIGITGWIVDERRGQDLREAIHDLPLNRLLLETDSPYLVPRDLPNKPTSRRNEPAFLLHIATVVATLKGISVEVLQQHCRENVQMAFGISA